MDIAELTFRGARRLLVPLLGVALVGCFSSGEPEPTSTSGDRLRRTMLEVEGLDPHFSGWHDRELGVECRMAFMRDGSLRCLPVGRAGVGRLYADPACTERVVRDDAECTDEGEYVMATAFSPSCDPERAFRTEVFELGARVEVSAFRERLGDSCSDVAPAIGGSARRVGESIPPDRFVLGERRRGQAVGGLAPERVVTEDGAGADARFIDLSRDERCFVPPQAYGLDRAPCIPESALSATLRGPACDDPRVEVSRDCGTPEMGYLIRTDACGGTESLEVSRLGPALPESERRDGDACSGLSGSATHRLTGEEPELVWLERVWLGEGRIRRAAFRSEGGLELSVPAPRHLDTELDLPCTFQLTSRGLRCIPGDGLLATSSEQLAYVDDECTEPALVQFSDCLPGHITLRAEACLLGEADRIEHLFAVGAPVEAEYALDPSSGECVERSRPGPTYALEAIALDSLAAGELVIE